MEVFATVIHFLYSRICIVNQATMWLSLLLLRMREFAVPSGAETMSVPLCSFPPLCHLSSLSLFPFTHSHSHPSLLYLLPLPLSSFFFPFSYSLLFSPLCLFSLLLF